MIGEFAGKRVRRMNMSEITLLNTVFGQHVNELLHNEITPYGRKMQEDQYRQLIAKFFSMFFLKVNRTIKAKSQSYKLTINYFSIVSVICCVLLALIGEPPASTANYFIFDDISIVVKYF